MNITVKNTDHEIFASSNFEGGEIHTIFRHYDFPVLFSFRKDGFLFLCVLSEVEDDFKAWTVTNVSEQQHWNILQNSLDIHKVFLNPSLNFLYYVKISDSLKYETTIIDREMISEDIIPMADTFANIKKTSQETSSYRYMEQLFDNAGRLGRVIVDMCLNSDTNKSSVDLRILGDISKHFQEFVDVNAAGFLGSLSNRGRVPEQAKGAGNLLAFATAPGSFVLRIAAEQYDLFENQVLIESIQRLESLVQNYEDDEAVRVQIQRIGVRGAAKYASLLGDILKLEGGFRLAWATPRGQSGDVQITQQIANSARVAIAKYVNDTAFNFETLGILISGNIRTKRFEIENDDSKFSGYADENVISTEHEASLGKTYRASLSEVRSINPSTGQETVKYILKSLMPI